MQSNRQFSGIISGGAALIAVLAAIAPANALNFSTFTNRTAWQNALTGTPSSENFNSFTIDRNFGSSSLTAGSLTLSSNAYDAPATGNKFTEARIDVSPYLLATGIDGTPMLSSNGLDIGENITVQLPSAFSAFAFDYENYDNQGEPLTVTIGGQNVYTLPATKGTKGFIGIVATGGSFNNVVLNSNYNTNNGTFNAIDNVAWGNTGVAVPFEFSPTLGLFAVGSLWGVNHLRKRRAVNKIV
jgi:hypothetical protein